MIPAPHLNESLKMMLPLASMKSAEIVKACRTPYLTLKMSDDTTTPTDDFLYDDRGLFRTPFSEFRYCCDYVDENGLSASMFGYVEKKDGILTIINTHPALLRVHRPTEFHSQSYSIS